jgi:hypothetical protein
VTDKCLYIGTYAVSLIAHNDDAIGRERLIVYVVSFKEGAIDGGSWLNRVYRAEELGEWHIVYTYSSHSSHRGLYGFGTKGIGSAYGTEYVSDSKPIGQSDDSA